MTPTTETGSLFLQPDRNLALELVRATEAAAIRAQPWVGRGEKNLADGAAVDAMRKFLGTVNFDGYNNYGTDFTRVAQIQDGKRVLVWPKDVADAELVEKH